MFEAFYFILAYSWVLYSIPYLDIMTSYHFSLSKLSAEERYWRLGIHLDHNQPFTSCSELKPDVHGLRALKVREIKASWNTDGNRAFPTAVRWLRNPSALKALIYPSFLAKIEKVLYKWCNLGIVGLQGNEMAVIMGTVQRIEVIGPIRDSVQSRA